MESSQSIKTNHSHNHDATIKTRLGLSRLWGSLVEIVSVHRMRERPHERGQEHVAIGGIWMSGSKFGPMNTLTVGHQRSSLRQTDEWSEDCESILSMLERSSAPRTRKDIQFEQMLGDNATLNRLEDLMNANDVRRRSDGPDGRLVYYEPTKTWHVSWGGEWGGDIGLVDYIK